MSLIISERHTTIRSLTQWCRRCDDSAQVGVSGNDPLASRSDSDNAEDESDCKRCFADFFTVPSAGACAKHARRHQPIPFRDPFTESLVLSSGVGQVKQIENHVFLIVVINETFAVHARF